LLKIENKMPSPKPLGKFNYDIIEMLVRWSSTLLIKWLSKSDMIWLQDNTLKNCLNIGKIGSVRILLSTVCGGGSSDQHFYDIIIEFAQWFRSGQKYSNTSNFPYI
jgi:hypothetical protein